MGEELRRAGRSPYNPRTGDAVSGDTAYNGKRQAVRLRRQHGLGAFAVDDNGVSSDSAPSDSACGYNGAVTTNGFRVQRPWLQRSVNSFWTSYSDSDIM
jgi:hypothetical protein